VLASAIAPVAVVAALWAGAVPTPTALAAPLGRLPARPRAMPIDDATIDAWTAATRRTQPTSPWYVPASWRCIYVAPLDLSPMIPDDSSPSSR
jgi:hypothetical protein